MRAASRKEAGSGATLSSLKDATAVSPASLPNSITARSPVAFTKPQGPSAPIVTPKSPKASGGCPSIYLANFVNLSTLLRSGALGTIRWDEFQRTEVVELSGLRMRFDDVALTGLAADCERAGLTNVRLGMLRRVVQAIAKANPFDSIKEWLLKLPRWDGVKRVEHFLPDYLGTPSGPYELAVSAYWWTAMAARILEPGYKVDMVPVLVGKQGIGKTLLLENIVPAPEHYGDVCLTDRPTELALRVIGKIVAGWEELRGICGRMDADAVKTFITNRTVELRSRTRTGMDSHPRRFVIVGTSNRRDFLRDPTGHRRYLPFDVGLIDLDRVKSDKDQLWAEALHLVLLRQANGQPLVAYEDAERLAAAEHQKYLDQGRWVDDEALTSWVQAGADKFRTDEALKVVGLNMSVSRPDRLDMGKSLRQLGFEFRPTHVRGQPGKPKRWRRP